LWQRKLIDFNSRNEKYLEGHWLILTEKGRMDAWINYSYIVLAKLGFQNELLGKAELVVYEF